MLPPFTISTIPSETDRNAGDDATEAEHSLIADGGTPQDDIMSIQTSDTTDTSTDEYSDKALRERFPEVLQGRGHKSKVLHIPGPDGDPDEPLCDRYSGGEMRRADVACFPPGWNERGFCDSCVDRLRERDRAEVPDGHGSALESDWG